MRGGFSIWVFWACGRACPRGAGEAENLPHSWRAICIRTAGCCPRAWSGQGSMRVPADERADGRKTVHTGQPNKSGHPKMRATRAPPITKTTPDRGGAVAGRRGGPRPRREAGGGLRARTLKPHCFCYSAGSCIAFGKGRPFWQPPVGSSFGGLLNCGETARASRPDVTSRPRAQADSRSLRNLASISRDLHKGWRPLHT